MIWQMVLGAVLTLTLGPIVFWLNERSLWRSLWR